MIDYIKLIRPPLFFMGFLASWALLVKSGLWGSDEALLILLAVGFGNAAFTLTNEIHDIKQDKINKPWKPLPSGRVPVFHAKIITLVFYAISIASLLMLTKFNIKYLTFGILGYYCAIVYNLRERGVFGNICLGFTYAIAAFMSTGFSDPMFSFAFGLLTVAHNIMVQYQDLEADKKAKVVTFPQVVPSPFFELTVIALSIVSSLVFLQIKQLIFAIAAVLVLISVLTKQHIESLIRFGVRFLMLIGFVLMGVGYDVLVV